MALPSLRHPAQRSLRKQCHQCISQMNSPRYASTAAAPIDELEQSSFQAPELPSDEANQFDPVGKAKGRRKQLPPSRYQFRPPKYYRGPLAPYQPPPSSDPSSREFVPGPFSLPRMGETYKSTIAQDMMTLSYSHVIPGTPQPAAGQRLRTWDGDSPYFANRPLRAPKGGHVLRPLHKRITFRNVPRLEKITVHSMSTEAGSGDSAYLHVTGMVIQAITNVRVKTHEARTTVQQWGLKKGKYSSVTAEMKGEDMYHFLSKCVDLVMPRIKDWKGVKGSSGDETGNISFGLDPDVVALFPEIEVNYDMYPPKMIPGCHVTVHTTANSDKEARLLLTAFGLPFYGKLIN
ncbi:ribosomal protein L5 [Tothia fuscella]|uniref:Large ribosomal subunit protein uL5m n=1 Tax=Tothia fuscella TaxID=1048955 RepID=A0A9P4NRK6_9PEZI|nr:ribosomal protein L5 [Tothia fuscella]